jgi:phosphoserine phosphatase
MIHNTYKKIVIMDVDGVLFKGQFLLHLARSLGILVYIRTVLLCFLFNMNKNSIQQLLTRVYECFKGIEFEYVQKVYKKVPLIRNAKETIEALRNHGYYVILMSSGVPDIFVKDLAARLSANTGYGIEIDLQNERLTGGIFGSLAKPNGKKHLVEEILRENNLTWQNTIVLVDDRNNLDIMHETSTNIGVNAHYAVRQRANYLIDSGDLAEVLDILTLADAHTSQILFTGMRKQFTRSWYQEIRRKLIHILIACAPVFSGIIYHTTLIVLLTLLATYTISECLRINGYSFPLLGRITKSSIRKAEERNFAFGPITLILGTVVSLYFFPPLVALTVIWIVAFADTAATLVGRSLGVHRLPYNKKKSLEGTLAALIIAFLCVYIYLPAPTALLTAAFSSIIESLPLKSLDNLLMPICTGILLLWLGYS